MSSRDTISEVVIYPAIKNGDIDLLKTIDFELFTKEEIYNMITFYGDNGGYRNQCEKECIKYLIEQLGDYVHETTKYMGKCNYCTYYSNNNNYVVHKIKLNSHGERIMLCGILREIVANEKLQKA